MDKRKDKESECVVQFNRLTLLDQFFILLLLRLRVWLFSHAYETATDNPPVPLCAFFHEPKTKPAGGVVSE